MHASQTKNERQVSKDSGLDICLSVPSLSRKLFLRLTPNTTSEVGHFLKPTTLVPDPNQKQLKKKLSLRFNLNRRT